MNEHSTTFCTFRLGVFANGKKSAAAMCWLVRRGFEFLNIKNIDVHHFVLIFRRHQVTDEA